jgi:hypothetical protein
MDPILSSTGEVRLKILRIGVMGHALLEFDGKKALELLQSGIDRAIVEHHDGHDTVEIVCNLTNPALSRLGCQVAQQHGWLTAGVARHGSLNYSGEVDRPVVAGDDYASVFVDNIDVAVRVGGVSTTADEVALCRAANKAVYEFDL